MNNFDELKKMNDEIMQDSDERAHAEWIILIPDRADCEDLLEIANDVELFKMAKFLYEKIKVRYLVKEWAILMQSKDEIYIAYQRDRISAVEVARMLWGNLSVDEKLSYKVQAVLLNGENEVVEVEWNSKLVQAVPRGDIYYCSDLEFADGIAEMTYWDKDLREIAALRAGMSFEWNNANADNAEMVMVDILEKLRG